MRVSVIRTLFCSALTRISRLDDIEDSSPLRRANPATHTIFGCGQTGNSANYQIIQALDEVRKLDCSQCLEIFSGKRSALSALGFSISFIIEEMRNLFLGQSLDLHWTCNLICPSLNEYLKMLDQSTPKPSRFSCSTHCADLTVFRNGRSLPHARKAHENEGDHQRRNGFGSPVHTDRPLFPDPKRLSEPVLQRRRQTSSTLS